MTAATRFLRPFVSADNPAPAPAAGDDAPGAAARVAATLRETTDAPASVATGYTMSVGDSFLGSVSQQGDEDVVRIHLEAGHRYVFDLSGTGLRDTVLGVFDRNGNLLASNDDHDRLDHSVVTIGIGQTGYYYLGVAGYGAATGSYALTAADSGPAPNSLTFTIPQIARQLTDGFWESEGGSRMTFDVRPGGTLTVDMSQLNAEGQQLARMALSAWSQVTGIRFDTTSRAGAQADIQIDDADNSGAYCTHRLSDTSTIAHAHVNIPLSWHESPGEGFASYEYQTFLHELGHALGLGHAGDYNGSATYGVDNDYANDSWQATVMSYFSQTENTAIDASYAFAVTPMIADIMAIQQLYGRPAGMQAGNSVWGVNGTVGGGLGQALTLLTQGETVTATIFDQGGNDWLNLSTDQTAQRIDLRSGAISDVYGLIGNLTIAGGTLIENLRCGTGDDDVWGNASSNFIWGNAGNDTLRGDAGDDTLQGGAGTDRLIGGTGNDVYLVDAGDTMVERAGGGIDHVRAWSSRALGANLEFLTLENVAAARNGTGNALDNVLNGNGYGNYLSGNGGDDTILGLLGDDTLVGGAGADRLVGGDGNDLYLVDTLDTVVEAAGEGIDMVSASVSYVLGANIENLVLAGAAALNGTGNALANSLQGNAGANHLSGLAGNDTLLGLAGNDTLQGGEGVDRLVGGDGNDTYIADALDTLVELVNGGIDQVRAWVNYRLGDNLEALLLGDARTARYGTGNDDHNTVVGGRYDNYLSGLGGNDTLFGMDGNDTLDGNIGADRLIGGTGDDLYLSDGFDTIVEEAGGGIDTVHSTVDIALGNHVENATLTGTRGANILGNYLDNVLTGNGGANVITSAGGMDEMWGLGGADAFVFAMGQGGRIGDFQDNVDELRIDVDDSRGLTVDDIIATGRNTATGCELVLDDVVLRIDQIDLDALRNDLVLI